MTSQITTVTDTKPVAIEEEMKRSYLDYAMSVIVSRALPDVRDGLKPVHRRILYAMKVTGNEYNRPYRKSARVVGEVMGKYHPHGDMAIYDAMVRLTQDFSLRVTLIDGQGNFGSLDGDPAAASRYTEARLSKPAHDLLEDIDKDTVDFKPNYDDSEVEPTVLPARFPNLLVNGGSGIAVGMATSIPTHNLGEVIDACCALIDTPDLSLIDIMRIIPGPDFPTGGIIMGRGGIHEAFRTGRGGVIVRGKATIERGDKRDSIIITEIPYQVNKARFVEKIAELVKEKTIEGISDLRDESNRQGVRVVVDVKRDADADVILNQLYRYSQLQSSISYNMLALRYGRPEQLGLLEILHSFIEFREDVILRRTRFELNKARDKAHILLGFAIAVSNIDEIIALIRKASDRIQAKEQLMARTWNASAVSGLLSLMEEKIPDQNQYHLTETQANAILELRLHRLTSMERDKIRSDLEEIVEIIRDLIDILGSKTRVMTIMKDELLAVKAEYASARRTEIDESDSNVDLEDLIQKEDMVVTVSVEGYIKRVPLSTYRSQRRGGKGRSGMTTKQEDGVSTIFVANTHSQVYFFSSLGQVYRMKVYRLPLGSPTSNGRAIINLLPLSPNEKIATILVCEDDVDFDNNYFMFATSKGNVRRNSLNDFKSINATGKKAIRLDDDEELIGVSLCQEDNDIMLSTKKAMCARFSVKDVRIFQSRDSNGVRGIRLADDDVVVSMSVVQSAEKLQPEERAAYLRMANQMRQQAGLEEDENPDLDITDDGQEEDPETDHHAITLSQERFDELAAQEQFILSISEKGMGKRTSAYNYRLTKRSAKGSIAMKITSRTGPLVTMTPVQHNDQIMMVTNHGRLIRCGISEISIVGRNSQGVIVFRVDSDERVVSVSIVGPVDDTEDMIDADDATLLTATDHQNVADEAPCD